MGARPAVYLGPLGLTHPPALVTLGASGPLHWLLSLPDTPLPLCGLPVPPSESSSSLPTLSWSLLHPQSPSLGPGHPGVGGQHLLRVLEGERGWELVAYV